MFAPCYFTISISTTTFTKNIYVERAIYLLLWYEQQCLIISCGYMRSTIKPYKIFSLNGIEQVTRKKRELFFKCQQKK